MATLPRPLLGWPLLTVPDEHGQLTWPDAPRSVRDGLRAILSTRPGEQLMRPDFGAGLERWLHQPNTVATRREIRDAVQQALTRWEPRLLLDGVDVLEVAGQPAQLRVEIAYRLARNGAPAEMTVTLDREG